MMTKKKVRLRILDKNYIIIKCFNRNEFRKTFLDTIGLQKVKKNIVLGILIFEKKIKNKGYSKYFLYGCIKFVKHLYGNNNYFAGIKKNNLKSIYLFKSLGFKVKVKYQKNYLFYLNYKKIKTPKFIDVFSI